MTKESEEYYEVIPLTYGRGRIILTDGYQVFSGW